MSAAATLNYERDVFADYRLAASLNGTYRDEVVLSNFGILGQAPRTAEKSQPRECIGRAEQDAWLFGVYATNLANERALLSPGKSRPVQQQPEYG